jgi:hypothetical protein
LNGSVRIFGGFSGERLGVKLPNTVLGVRKHVPSSGKGCRK